jgi:propanol-preferring alcohol dehydrogenase
MHNVEILRGVLLRGNRQVIVQDFPDPEPGFGQVVVRMKASGICGTEVHYYRQAPEELSKVNWAGGKQIDLIQGHEPCGIVEKVGEGVESLKKGDRVMVYQNLGCGHCFECLNGDTHYCEQHHTGTTWITGVNRHGGFADMLLFPAHGCLSLPDELSFVDGAVMACSGGTVYQTFRNLGITGRETLAIFGLGPLGQCAVMIGKAIGAKIIGVELSKERLRLAEHLGADEVIDVESENPVDSIRALTGTKGADAIIDFSGSAVAQSNALEAVRRHGRVSFIGVQPGGKVAIDPTRLIMNDLTLRSQLIFRMGTYFEMAEFMVSHDVHFEDIVTNRFSLEDAGEALKLVDTRTAGKAVFVW